MSPTDGGPAFPLTTWDADSSEHRRGMSLRDYFAALAMAAYVAKEGPASDEDGDFVAMYAYQIADAMLAERAK